MKPGLPSLRDRRYLPLLLALTLVALVQASVGVLVTFAVAHAFDGLSGEAAPGAAAAGRSAPVALGLVLIAGVAFASRWADRALAERLGQRYAFDLRLTIWDHLMTLPARSVAGGRRGATVLRFIGDLGTLKSWISRGVVGAALGATTIVGAVAALAWLSWRLAAVALVLIAVMVTVQGSLGRVLSRRIRALRRSRSRLATDIVERVGSLGVIQSNSQENRERRRLEKKSGDLLTAAEKTANASGALLGLAELSSVTMMLGMLVVGALEVSASAVSPGEVVGALVLARYLGRPIRQLSRVHERWLRAAVARTKLEQFFALRPLAEPDRGKRLKPGSGAVKLRGVVVRGVLDRVSARAAAGEVVRLTGANGSGKSTILRLLAGLERPQGGKVVLDGRDLSRCRLSTIRPAVKLVSPDLPLMRGTFRRNLTYGHPKASGEEIGRVLAATDLEALVDRLPEGLGTRVAEGGTTLSAGERHRLQLARALLARPRVLLLDEANSFFDQAGLAAVAEVIRAVEATVVFVWNGPDAPASDRVWSLADGRLTSRRVVRTRRPQPRLEARAC